MARACVPAAQRRKPLQPCACAHTHERPHSDGRSIGTPHTAGTCIYASGEFIRPGPQSTACMSVTLHCMASQQMMMIRSMQWTLHFGLCRSGTLQLDRVECPTDLLVASLGKSIQKNWTSLSASSLPNFKKPTVIEPIDTDIWAFTVGSYHGCSQEPTVILGHRCRF